VWADMDRSGRTLGRIKWKLFFDFQLNLDFGKTLKISGRGLRRNLDMGFFPKFF
jgi:hypothetical protein